MSETSSELNYGDYLQLQRLLSAQTPLQPAAHDELLFIVVHQAYELWFKQIIFELKSIQQLFSAEPIEERMLSTVSARLERITCIQQLLIDQIGVLETMTPLDFLDFRDTLTPASGFQSVQFREIEMRLGIDGGPPPEGCLSRLKSDEQHYLKSLASEDSLFTLLDRWLARMPFLRFGDFDFWQSYRETTRQMLEADSRILQQHPHLTDSERQIQLQALQQSHRRFDALFNYDSYRQLLDQRQVRLSQQALLAALFINLYRDEPILHQPFLILTRLVEIEERLSTWRYRHMIMVQRMLGSKIGTGGSAGHSYLKATTERRRIFEDLFNLSSWLIPRSRLPRLPASLRQALDFHFSGQPQED